MACQELKLCPISKDLLSSLNLGYTIDNNELLYPYAVTPDLLFEFLLNLVWFSKPTMYATYGKKAYLFRHCSMSEKENISQK